jgi:hypothetical protein
VNTVAAKQDIRAIVSEAGWSFQPRLWWFQVRRSREGQVPGALLASLFPRVSEGRFWGVVYPALYVLFIVYTIAISGGWPSVTGQTAFALLAVSALWWGIWGAITWLLVYQSRPRNARSGKRFHSSKGDRSGGGRRQQPVDPENPDRRVP